MAGSDVTRDATKPADGQIDFSGGMDWISDAAKSKPNSARLLVNVDIRNGNAEKARGQRPLGELEIGARYYDTFNSADLDTNFWSEYTAGDGIVDVNSDFKLSITGRTSSHAWDGTGVVSNTTVPTATLSYTEFLLTTPASVDSNTRFRIGLSGSAVALDTDSGVEVEFDESLNIIKREASSETDTTVNWVASTTYRIRLEKLGVGYKAYLVDLTNAEHTAVTLFETSIAGNEVAYLEFQAYGGVWLIDDVVVHEGFGASEERLAPTGVHRFYKETATNETVVIAHGVLYTYTDAVGYTKIGDGFDTTARCRFRVFNDSLYIVNGVDDPKVYDSSTVQNVGSGGTAPPLADTIEVHLQSLFMLKENSLYRNVVGNPSSWDALSPLVDVDAWNGDIGKGMVKLGANLYIIKSSSVWELVGTQNNNFVLRRVLGSRGCVATDSIATNGQVAFWRGIDGVYRFDGVSTKLISFRIHAAFDSRYRSEYPTTLSSKADESVGVVHDFKYRISVVQYGESNLDYNNFEYIYDMLADGGKGGWFQRSNRECGMYTSWEGDGDNNELIYSPSDTSNSLMVGEVDTGNYRSTYENISLVLKTDVDFPGRIVSRKYTGTGQSRSFLDKAWSDCIVMYEPKANIRIGFVSFTRYNTQGSLVVFDTTTSVDRNVLDGASLPLNGTELLANVYLEEKSKNIRLDSQMNKNKGSEFWFEIKQDADVRAATKDVEGLPVDAIVKTGLLANIGNFQPFSIKRVIVRFTEENH